MGDEQLLQMDSSPLFGRPSPPGLAGAWLLECGTGFFRFGDDLHAHLPAAVQCLQLFKGRHSKEIPVRQEQRIPKSKGGMVSVLHHLHHMEGGWNRCPLPPDGSLQAVMEPDAQRDARPVADAPLYARKSRLF